METEKALAARLVTRPENRCGTISWSYGRHVPERGPDRQLRSMRWSLVARGGPEFAVDSQADPAHRQQADPGFGLAGFEQIADPELPLPDAGRRRRHNHIFHTPVIQIHGIFPAVIRCNKRTTKPWVVYVQYCSSWNWRK